MYLQEVFDSLALGELSQLAIGGGADGEISEDDYPRLVNHVNLGLTALYKRFHLKEGRLKLNLIPGKYLYPIKQHYTTSDTASVEPVRYLVDDEDPFRNDLLKIEEVMTDLGHTLPLNDLSAKYSVFTPSAAVLRINEEVVDQSRDLPDHLKTTQLTLIYRANHPKIVVGLGFFDPSKVELQLPESHLEPLLLFIASRIHNPIGMTGEFNAGNNYSAKYEMACAAIESLGLQVNQDSQNTRLKKGGWA